MKNILKIFIDDVKRIRKNVIAMIVVIGVPKPGNKDDPNPDQPEKPKPKLKL